MINDIWYVIYIYIYIYIYMYIYKDISNNMRKIYGT